MLNMKVDLNVEVPRRSFNLVCEVWTEDFSI